jgi:hypothetical protein
LLFGHVFLLVTSLFGDGCLPGFGRGDNLRSFSTCPDRSGRELNE